MKFIAVIDYDLVDKEFNTVCIKDKDGNLHDIDAKPLITHMIVLDEGQVVPYREKTGHWIEEPGNVPHCSVCGTYSDDADRVDGGYYCTHCGAKMTWE